MIFEKYDVYECSGNGEYLLVPEGCKIDELDLPDNLNPQYSKTVSNQKGLIGAPSVDKVNDAFSDKGYLITYISITTQEKTDSKL